MLSIYTYRSLLLFKLAKELPFDLASSNRLMQKLAPALLIVEQLPTLVAEQVKAIQNLQIDKITVWDSGNGGTGNADVSWPGASPDTISIAVTDSDWSSSCARSRGQISRSNPKSGSSSPG